MSDISLPLIALRGLVVFPGMTIQFDAVREKSINALKKAMESNQMVVFCAQKDADKEKITVSDIHKTGTISRVKQVVKVSEKVYRVIAEGINRAYVSEMLSGSEYFTCIASYITDINNDESDVEIAALCRKARNLYIEYMDYTKKYIKSPQAVLNISKPSAVSDVICSTLNVTTDELQKLLEETDVKKRLETLIVTLTKEINIFAYEKVIDKNVSESIDKNQKDYYLREKLKVIKDELGMGFDANEDEAELEDKIKALNLESQYEEELLNEAKKLNYVGPMSQEYGVLKTHLDTVLKLPFNTEYSEFKSFEEAETFLNESHFGMVKVKERILDNLAARIFNNQYSGNIICLAGPPGVGKTSIANSVAQALGRKFVKISLGGVKDESEIRGHRKTYVGAMPGKVASAYIRAKCNNPVFLLDEIDKLSSDYKGDPTSALLEVLDPEQNKIFTDNYISIPFDLSKTLFIATANDLSEIPYPLRDRMDIIELESYTVPEKLSIAKDYLIPKQLKAHKLKGLKLSDAVILKIIEDYTREAGVRQLERCISTICNKTIRELLKDKKLSVSLKNLEDLLGKPFTKDDDGKLKAEVGIVNGLAWTMFGGDVLKVEAGAVPGAGKVDVTGNLGEVMKESVNLSLSVVKALMPKLNTDEEFFKKNDLHIHFPEGAVPKDGPSAGITITTAIVSAITGRKPKAKLAMTGEITLNGSVLAIGGVREKLLAAKRKNITDVIVPASNRKDVEEYEKQGVKFELNIHYVKNIEEVLKTALNKE